MISRKHCNNVMKYSFVLPAYKAKFFQEALDSILSQTYKDFELIIVNDASPEDLDSIVKSYDDIRIRYYVNEQNIGGKDLVAQWNHCLNYADGEYVILASDDDVYSPLYLKKMDELVCRYPDVNVFRPRIQIIDESNNVMDVLGEISERVSRIEFFYYWMKEHVGSGIPYYVFKKEAILSIRGFHKFPLAWFSDDATVFELSKNDLVFCNEVLFSFRFSGINITTKKNTTKVLSHKLTALVEFDRWICPIINEMSPQDERDIEHFEYIKNNWISFVQYKAYDLLNHSSLGAAVMNLKFLINQRWCSVCWAVKSYTKILIKRLMNK